MMVNMAAPKGRVRRGARGYNPLFSRVSDEALAILEAGAAALGVSRSAYIDMLVRRTELDEHGLPGWARDALAPEQVAMLPSLEEWVQRTKQMVEEGANRRAA